jgi:hypothetical protein
MSARGAIQPSSNTLLVSLGTDFSDSDKVFIEQLETKLDSNDFLKASVRINSQSVPRLTFNDVVSDEIHADNRDEF